MMKKMIFSVAVAITVGFVIFGSKSIFSSSGTSRDKVDAIIDKYVEARGGHELLQAIKSAKLTGKLVDGGKEYTTTAFYQRPNLVRVNDELANESIVTAFDGREAWWSFDGDPPVPVPGDEMFIYDADFEGPLVNYQKKGHQVKFLGVDTVDGREVSKLALTLKRGQTWTIYIDNTSYLEVKRVWDNGPAGFEFLPGDYRRVNGVLIPFSMKNKLGNEIVSERVFESIETNVDIDRALFNRSSIQPKNRPANAQAALTELTDLAQLKKLFNRDEGLVRVVTLLSPSCPGCRRGYQDMIQILKNIPDDRLRFYNVFFNVLSSDNHAHAEDRARQYSDPRVTNLWDGKRLTGWAWKDRLDMPSFAWDAYFLYDGNADWNEQLPEPAFWMHQGVGTGKAPYLDATVFEAKVRGLLAGK